LNTKKRILLTSVCRPIGERHGDAPSVGYELLHGQVTRAQGLFGPRSLHVQFSLEYIAENLDAPTTVLQYPSKSELVRELKEGYDVVGLTFVLATFHRMKDVVALVRRHSPRTQIVLGGYGTVLSDEVLRPFCDHICREEGVGYMRRLLGEPEIPIPYRQPRIVNPLRIFGREVSRTGIVIGGLGCPNGCDFCCTSQYFHRKHIRLLPTGADLYGAVQRYLDVDPRMNILIIDEDFLLNRRRALEFRDCVQAGGRPLSVFVFASIRAISQYTVTEILEMGIDGMWIGYEGTRSGYAKQSGRPVDEIFDEFREHGITILASMIVGFPYQTPEIIEEELGGLLALKPVFAQFLIYGPCPGTPFYEKVVREGTLVPEVRQDKERFFRQGAGFHSMVQHPTMSSAEIEAAQQRCFEEEFRRLGPSIYRSVERCFEGHLTLRASPNPFLRAKAERHAADVRKAYPSFLVGKLFGPTREARRGIADLERRIKEALGPPTLRERLESVAAVALAAWTSLTLRLGLFQHPKLMRHTFRMPDERSGRTWARLRGRISPEGTTVEVEQRPVSTVWVRLEGSLSASAAAHFSAKLRAAMSRKKERVVLDLGRVSVMDARAAHRLAEGLRSYRHRIRVILPRIGEAAALAAVFSHYQ
jgi:radical SAM superfamily enzyme YgiQ (UPF0313 family)/anti-anti-sigma regulatory factor